ncbi:MAG: LacI family transcriptional regulator [Angelakisella sp.]|nr:LacI family transcriptional regulator [Angelakisella sp.]
MASQKEIAAAAGVSVSTVSRVLGGMGEKAASPEVARRIWEVARQLGYTPNPAARALRLGAPTAGTPPRIVTLLARVTDTESDPFFQALAQAVDEEILRQGCPLLSSLPLTQGMERDCRELERLRPQGLVLLGRCSGEAARRLGRRWPSIAVGLNPAGQSAVDQVLCSGREAARMAVEHLLERGHTRIAYLGECTVENRYSGYRELLAEKGLPFRRELVGETRQTEEGGERGVASLLKLEKPPTAIFCANDSVAIGAVRGLRKRGLSVPADLAIISVDDIAPAGMVHPQLTTIHIPKDDMGRLAVRLLLDRLQGGHSEVLQLRLPCRLVVRESTG